MSKSSPKILKLGNLSKIRIEKNHHWRAHATPAFLDRRLACDFLEYLPLSPIDKEKITHGNAERTFRI